MRSAKADPGKNGEKIFNVLEHDTHRAHIFKILYIYLSVFFKAYLIKLVFVGKLCLPSHFLIAILLGLHLCLDVLFSV